MKKLVMLVLAIALCLSAVSAMAYGPYTEDTVLDLAGQTITLTEPIWVKGGTLTVKNGTINSVDDAFIVGRRYYSGPYPDSAATLIIESSVTINVTGNNCNCVYLYGTDGKKAKVVTYGKLSSENGGAIQGNGDAVSGEVQVLGGSVTSTNDVAIYHPQNDALIIKNAKVTGTTAVEIRKGTATITNSTLTATAAFAEESNGSGSTTAGVALAVSPYSNVTVSTQGGSFIGEKAVYQADINGSGAAANLNVNGGTFDGPIEIEDGDATLKNLPAYTVIENNGGGDVVANGVSVGDIAYIIPAPAATKWDAPETGDTENMMLWVALLAMACVGFSATRKMSRE